jgi:hypothetical protein
MKDKRIRHRRAEIEAVIEHQARCFVIANGELASAEMANRFITHKNASYAAATVEPGPYIYSVRADRISILYPPR